MRHSHSSNQPHTKFNSHYFSFFISFLSFWRVKQYICFAIYAFLHSFLLSIESCCFIDYYNFVLVTQKGYNMTHNIIKFRISFGRNMSITLSFNFELKKRLKTLHNIYFTDMVLVLNGVLQDECIPLDTHSLFMQHPIYRDTANQLLSIPSKTVSMHSKRIISN